MNVLLVYPDSPPDLTEGKKNLWVPYGIVYLAAFLRKHSYKVIICDRRCATEDFYALLDGFRPDAVGVSVMTGSIIVDAVEVSKAVKRFNPRVPVVWGGIHPTLLPFQTLQEDFIDVVVEKEGEETFLDLLEAFKNNSPIKRVKGIYFKDDGCVQYTEPRPFLKDLDMLPMPAWDLLGDIKRYLGGREPMGININTSRGCPFHCAYCYNTAFNKGRGWKGLSAKRVIDQVEYLVNNYHIKFINFLEDNFTVDLRRVHEICDLFIERGNPVRWECESRVGLDKKTLEKMKNAGCEYIGFGVESGSPRMLEFIKKGIRLEEVIETFRYCREVGIKPMIYIMYGFPTETMEDVRANLNLLKKIDYYECDTMVFRPYPGTELHDFCVERKLFAPPKKLIDWVPLSNQHDSAHSVSNLSEDLYWKLILRNAKKNLWIKYRERYNFRDITMARILKVFDPRKSIPFANKWLKNYISQARKLRFMSNERRQKYNVQKRSSVLR
jgi:radical SAM superfamily enzyme YgiQ (UPF0313 family)